MKVVEILCTLDVEPGLDDKVKTLVFYFKQAPLEKIGQFFIDNENAFGCPIKEVTEGQTFESEQDAHKYYQEHWAEDAYHAWPILIVDNEPDNPQKT